MNNLEESIELIVKGCGVCLYDIVNLKENDISIYRVFITSKEGIDLDKCSEVSRLISPLLDLHEVNFGKYNLEVSSPGIERKLQRPSHFKLSIGDFLNVKDYNKESILGKLLFADDEKIILETNSGEKTVQYEDISIASTYYKWE